MQAMHKEIARRIEARNNKTAVNNNKKRKNGPQLKRGDKVYLLTKNMKSKRPSKKLDHVKVRDQSPPGIGRAICSEATSIRGSSCSLSSSSAMFLHLSLIIFSCLFSTDLTNSSIRRAFARASQSSTWSRLRSFSRRLHLLKLIGARSQGSLIRTQPTHLLEPSLTRQGYPLREQLLQGHIASTPRLRERTQERRRLDDNSFAKG